MTGQTRKATRAEASALSALVDTTSFAARAHMATINATTRSEHTRRAYLGDLRVWLEFCEAHRIDPSVPGEEGVVLWLETMKADGASPKTRVRRVASLCTIYGRLRRAGKNGEPPAVAVNFFSADQGPEREEALAIEPTALIEPAAAAAIMSTCDDSILGIRDAAIIRMLWGTGARTSTVIAMTFERMRRDGDEYVIRGIKKGNKEQLVLVRGAAATALARWIDILKGANLAAGPLWRTKRQKMTTRALDHMLRRRAQEAGVGAVSAHMFRTTFLTLNPAPLEAKQSAAGHASPVTTMGYDRTAWRGREAFERMPEIEALASKRGADK